jgi:hypothetical protein
LSDNVTKALSREEIEAIKAKKAEANRPVPTLVAPDGASRTKLVPLAWPIQLGDQRIDTLTVRRLTGRDFSRLTRLPEGDESAALAALMTDQPIDVISALDADDFANLTEACQDFLPSRMRAATG